MALGGEGTIGARDSSVAVLAEFKTRPQQAKFVVDDLTQAKRAEIEKTKAQTRERNGSEAEVKKHYLEIGAKVWNGNFDTVKPQKPLPVDRESELVMRITKDGQLVGGVDWVGGVSAKKDGAIPLMYHKQKQELFDQWLIALGIEKERSEEKQKNFDVWAKQMGVAKEHYERLKPPAFDANRSRNDAIMKMAFGEKPPMELLVQADTLARGDKATARALVGVDPFAKFIIENLDQPDNVTPGLLQKEIDRLQDKMGGLPDPMSNAEYNQLSIDLNKWRDELLASQQLNAMTSSGILSPEIVVAIFEQNPGIAEKKDWLNQRLRQLVTSATPTQTLAQSYQIFAQELRAIKEHFLASKDNIYAARYALTSPVRIEYEKMLEEYEAIDKILNWCPQVVGAGSWDNAFKMLAGIVPDPASFDRSINTCLHLRTTNRFGRVIQPVSVAFRKLEMNAAEYKTEFERAGGNVTNDYMVRVIGFELQGETAANARTKARAKENPDMMMFAYLAEQIWWSTWQAAKHDINPKYAKDLFDFPVWLKSQAGVPPTIVPEIDAIKNVLFAENKTYWETIASDAGTSVGNLFVNLETTDIPVVTKGKPRMVSVSKGWRQTEVLKKLAEGGSVFQNPNRNVLFKAINEANLFTELENSAQRTNAVSVLFNWVITKDTKLFGKWDKTWRAWWINKLVSAGLDRPILETKITK